MFNFFRTRTFEKVYPAVVALSIFILMMIVGDFVNLNMKPTKDLLWTMALLTACAFNVIFLCLWKLKSYEAAGNSFISDFYKSHEYKTFYLYLYETGQGNVICCLINLLFIVIYNYLDLNSTLLCIWSGILVYFVLLNLRIERISSLIIATPFVSILRIRLALIKI